MFLCFRCCFLQNCSFLSIGDRTTLIFVCVLLFNQLNDCCSIDWKTLLCVLFLLFKWLNDCCSIDWTTLLHVLFFLFKRLNDFCSINWKTLLHFLLLLFKHCSIDWTTLLFIFVVQTIERLMFNQLKNTFACFSFWFSYSIDWTIVIQSIELHFLYFCKNNFDFSLLFHRQSFFHFSFSSMFWIKKKPSLWFLKHTLLHYDDYDF